MLSKITQLVKLLSDIEKTGSEEGFLQISKLLGKSNDQDIFPSQSRTNPTNSMVNVMVSKGTDEDALDKLVRAHSHSNEIYAMLKGGGGRKRRRVVKKDKTQLAINARVNRASRRLAKHRHILAEAARLQTFSKSHELKVTETKEEKESFFMVLSEGVEKKAGGQLIPVDLIDGSLYFKGKKRRSSSTLPLREWQRSNVTRASKLRSQELYFSATHTTRGRSQPQKKKQKEVVSDRRALISRYETLLRYERQDERTLRNIVRRDVRNIRDGLPMEFLLQYNVGQFLKVSV